VPVIVRFEADRAAITFGEPLALTWAVVDAQSVVLQLPDGELPVEAQGSWTGTPNRTFVVTLLARGLGGDAVASLRIDVAPVFATPTPATAAPAAVLAEPTALPALSPTTTPVPSPTAAPPPQTVAPPTAVAPSAAAPAATATGAAPSPLQVAPAAAATAPAVAMVITPPLADAAASPTLAPVALVMGDAGAASAPRPAQEAVRADGQQVMLALVVLVGLVVAGGAAAFGAVIYLWMNRQP
jgi:hypothetical protein